MDKRKIEVSLTVRMLVNVGLEVEADTPMEAMHKVDEVIGRGQLEFILDDKSREAPWNNIQKSSGIEQGVNAYVMDVRQQYARTASEIASSAHWTAPDYYHHDFKDVQLTPMTNYGFNSKHDPKKFEIKDGKWVPVGGTYVQFDYSDAKKQQKKTGKNWQLFIKHPEIYNQGILAKEVTNNAQGNG